MSGGSPVFDLHSHLRPQPQSLAHLDGAGFAKANLTVLKRSVSPEIFRKIPWDNAHTLLKIDQSAAK